jgi:hypothetical protein
LRCQHLNELVINLPSEWKVAINSIYEKCESLHRLEITISNCIFGQKRDNFFQEFYETELFTSNSKYKSILTHLVLNGFNATASQGEHFKYFESLISIKFAVQRYHNFSINDKEIDMNLWSSHKLYSKYNRYNYDIEFKRV